MKIRVGGLEFGRKLKSRHIHGTAGCNHRLNSGTLSQLYTRYGRDAKHLFINMSLPLNMNGNKRCTQNVRMLHHSRVGNVKNCLVIYLYSCAGLSSTGNMVYICDIPCTFCFAI